MFIDVYRFMLVDAVDEKIDGYLFDVN